MPVAAKCPNACISFKFVAQVLRVCRLDCRKLGCFQRCVHGRRDRDRNSWPNIIAEPFFKTVSRHFRGIESPPNTGMKP